MQIHRLKRNLIQCVARHHNHAGNPEEQNLIAGLKHIGRVIDLQILRLIRPTKRRERPHAGRKPGVERVLILPPSFTFRHLAAAMNLFTLLVVSVSRTIPHRNPVTVPNLPANAPVTQIVNPIEINLIEVVGHYCNLPTLHRLTHNLLESRRLTAYGLKRLIHGDEPLQLRQRLNNTTRALCSSHVLVYLLLFHHQAFFSQPGDDNLPRLEHLLALKLGRNIYHLRILVNHLLSRQIVTHGHLRINLTVCRSHSECAGTKLLVHARVGDNLNVNR